MPLSHHDPNHKPLISLFLPQRDDPRQAANNLYHPPRHVRFPSPLQLCCLHSNAPSPPHPRLHCRPRKSTKQRTQQFKLGQYAAAADAYPAGIRALLSGHLLVRLYTNRTLAHIRCGEYKAAEDDCTRALQVVLDDNASGSEDNLGLDPNAAPKEIKSLAWSPMALPPSLLPSSMQTTQSAWTHRQEPGIDLTDGYVEALRRRMEALEGCKKWSAAAGDWELLAGWA